MQMRTLSKRGRDRWVLGAALIISALTSAGCQGVAPGSDRHVLVMDFEAPEEGLSKYSTSLAEMLTASMANYSRIAVLERQDIRTKQFGAPTYYWQRMGRKLGADYLMIGSIARLEDNYIINARLYSCQTGEIVKGSSTTRACKREDDIYPSIQAIAAVMAHHLKYLAEQYDAISLPQGRVSVEPAPPVSAAPGPGATPETVTLGP